MAPHIDIGKENMANDLPQFLVNLLAIVLQRVVPNLRFWKFQKVQFLVNSLKGKKRARTRMISKLPVEPNSLPSRFQSINLLQEHSCRRWRCYPRNCRGAGTSEEIQAWRGKGANSPSPITSDTPISAPSQRPDLCENYIIWKKTNYLATFTGSVDYSSLFEFCF